MQEQIHVFVGVHLDCHELNISIRQIPSRVFPINGIQLLKHTGSSLTFEDMGLADSTRSTQNKINQGSIDLVKCGPSRPRDALNHEVGWVKLRCCGRRKPSHFWVRIGEDSRKTFGIFGKLDRASAGEMPLLRKFKRGNVQCVPGTHE